MCRSCTFGRRGALPLWLVGLLLCVHISAAVALAADANDGVPPELQARVSAIFERFVTALQDDYPEVRDYIIEVIEERVTNAWINQDYEISVTTGLMDLLTTDDQLAGVIAHEIAHGILGHIPYRVNQHLWSVFAVVALGVISSTQGDADWGGLLHLRELFLYAYSREQETEADLLAVRLTRRAGYNPKGLIEALELMDAEMRSLASSDALWEELYSTHPSMGQRASELSMMLAANSLDRSPLGSGPLGSDGVTRSPEEAARRFAQALWSGDRKTLEQMSLPVRDGQVDQWFAQWQDRLDPSWATAELEIAERRENGFDEVLTVRLWRPSPHGEGEESTPAMALTLRRSARGWLVASWHRVD